MVAARRWPGLVFFGLAATVYALVFLLTHSPVVRVHPAVLGAGAADLLGTVPLLYFFLLVRPGYASPLTLGPVFLLSIWGATLTLPVHWPALRMVAAPLETALAVALVWRVRKAARTTGESEDRIAAIERIVRAALPVPAVAKLVAGELAVMYYALFSWKAKSEAPEGSECFSYAEASGLQMIALLLCGMTLLEAPAVHLVVRNWSHIAAWLLTALSVYGLVWLIGLWRAAAVRPYYVQDDVLHLRIGYLWSLDVPLHQIASCSRTAKEANLRAVWINDPQIWLELKSPVVARNLYGPGRQVTCVALAVDQPDAFLAAIQ